MLTRLIITSIIILFSANFSSAAFVMNENCREAYRHILNLKFDAGKKLIEKEKSLNPSNQIPYYLEHYIDFLIAFISEEKPALERLKANKSIRLTRIENDDSQSPYYLFIQAEILLQTALVRFKAREYLQGGYEIHKAYRLLVNNQKKFPDFKGNNKSLGLLHAVIGSFPEEYSWVSGIAGFSGTLKQGSDELKALINSPSHLSYSYLKQEAIIILFFIELNLNKNEVSAKQIINSYEQESADKTVLLYYTKASMSLKTGECDNAVSTLCSRSTDKDQYPFYYLDYLTGLAKLYRLDADADIYLLKFVNNFKGRNFIRSAYQKLAWHYLVHGNEEKYKLYIKQCLLRGDDFVDEDKQAIQEAESKEIPNIYLLKARLLFDGGYYQPALSVVAGKPVSSFPTLKDKLEFTYRLGRIYHKLNMTDKAIHSYQITLQNGENHRYYFAANSALNLAYIYEEKKNVEKAKYYYKKCLSLRDHDYQNSIDQKAKTGLNKLN